MRTAGVFLAVIFVAALGLFGYRKYGDWQAGQLVKWRADSSRVADSTRVAVQRAMKKDTIYLAARASYTGLRARTVAAGPVSSRDSAVFAMCDLVVQTCDERHAADTAVAAALRAELAVARAKPSERAKRLTIYGAGLYDLMNAAPVFRAGTDLRLLGGISGMVEGELAVPSAVQCQTGTCGVRMRALVGVRYVF